MVTQIGLSLALLTLVNFAHAEVPSSLELKQWGLHNSGAPQTYDIDDVTSISLPGKAEEDIGLSRMSTKSPRAKNKIIVAVLDTGVDVSHPDLKNQILKTDCVANSGLKDCTGWNFVTDSADVKDTIGHGTHVAGIIAANSKANGHANGARGVSDQVEILPVKVISSAPNDGNQVGPRQVSQKYILGFADTIAKGINYAVAQHAQVINLSMAWPAGVNSPDFRLAVQNASLHHVLIVASAGNDSTESRVTPCEIDGVICVAAHNPDGSLSHFSNFGSQVEVAAPGIHILSTWPMEMRSLNYTERQGYEILNGTSMAAPFVSGVVAELLSLGFSPDETYARLLAGSRSQASHPERDSKYLLGGNVDLARSEITPVRPLIFPRDKTIARAIWDDKSERVSFSIPLKNYWAQAERVRVAMKLVSSDFQSQLETTQFSVAIWKSLKSITLKNRVLLKNKSADGKILLEISVQSDGTPAQVFRVPLEISREVGPQSLGTETFLLKNGLLNPNTQILRSITPVGFRGIQDYVSLENTESGEVFAQLVAQRNSNYEARPKVSLGNVGGDLLIGYRFSDGVYSLIFTVPGVVGALPVFHFQMLDASFKPTYTMDYDNATTVLRDSFQWTNINDSKILSPVWISPGLTPPVEKPAYDPWDTTTQEAQLIRCYYLSYEATGETVLRSIAPPDGYILVNLLTASLEQKSHGEIPVLLSQGEDYKLNYFTAIIRGKKMSDVKPLSLNSYRMLLGLNNVLDLHSLDGKSVGGNVFGSNSAHGSFRATYFPNTISEGADFTLDPVSQLDPVIRMNAAFTDSVFAETRYTIRFFDRKSGKSAATSLNRFSFLPALITSKNFFPAVVRTESKTHPRVPALTSPLNLGASSGPVSLAPELESLSGTEVIVPVYSKRGDLEGLSHPVRLRFRAQEGCTQLGNPIDADSNHPSRIVFFCGDRFLRVPLELN